MKSQLQTIIVSCSILIIGVIACIFLHLYINRCKGPCGRLGIRTSHERECRAGHNYYSCDPNQVKQHLYCSPGDPPLKPYKE